MKFTIILPFALAAMSVAALPVAPKVAVAMGRDVPHKRALASREFSSSPSNAKRAVNYGRTKRDTRRISKRVNAALVPDFGLAAGLNPTGTGDCDGVAGPNGQPIKIPCSCPPNRDDFIRSLEANVAAGRAVNNPSISISFPEDNSKESQLARLNAATVTLQNLRGPGAGCPASATTFNAQRVAIENGTAAPAAAPVAAPARAPAPAPAVSTVASLAPDFGRAAGINPTGTGDCDGVAGPDGQPIKVPCSCPPARDEFIRQLEANVAAGRAVKNPGVTISYPLDDSNASKRARITASLITLQNLNGPGVGCPASSTTLLAQQNAIPA